MEQNSQERFYIDEGRWKVTRLRSRVSTISLSPVEHSGGAATNALYRPKTIERVQMLRDMLRSGAVRNRAELARRLGVSRARISQLLGPATVAPQNTDTSRCSRKTGGAL